MSLGTHCTQEKQPHIKNDKVCTLNSLYFSVKLEDGMDPIPSSFHLRKNSTKKLLNNCVTGETFYAIKLHKESRDSCLCS